MGPMWVFIWVLYGQTIWDQHGFCNRAPYGTYMGKPIWVAYGNHMGPIWVNHLFCNMDPFGTHMGKHIWDPYGSIMRNFISHIGPIYDPYGHYMGTIWPPLGIYPYCKGWGTNRMPFLVESVEGRQQINGYTAHQCIGTIRKRLRCGYICS